MNDSDASPVIQYEERAVESDTTTSTDLLSSNDAFVRTTPHVCENLSEPETLMSFIKSNLGTGMLSMPIVLRYTGLWIGFFAIIAAGFISTYLMNVLVRTTRSVRQRHGLELIEMDYTETVFHVFKHGPESLRRFRGKLKHTVNVFLLITQIGFLCVYVLFLTENIRRFSNSLLPELPVNFYLVGFLVALTLIPMCLCNNMRILAYFSVVANVATLLGTVLIFVFLFSAGLRPVTSFPVYTNVPNLLIGFSIAMCTFEGISLILPIQNKMANPEFYANPAGVLNVGMVFVIGINAALGFYGFLAIGDTVEGSITLNIGERPYWFAPIKPLFVLAIYVSYVLQYYVPATIFARLMEKVPCHRHASGKRRSLHVNFMRVSLVLFTYLMVIAVPKLELMISLIGSFASSVLAFIMPSVLEIVHLWSERTRIRHFWLVVVCKHTLFIVLGLVTFLGGTTATLFKVIQAFGPSHVSAWPVVL